MVLIKSGKMISAFAMMDSLSLMEFVNNAQFFPQKLEESVFVKKGINGIIKN